MKRWEDFLQVLDDFASKFLRVRVVQDDRLELQLAYKWAPAKADQQTKQEQKEDEVVNCAHTDRECLYFTLAMLFFAEAGSQGAIEVDLLDTLFFLPDHSIYYVYRDARKGLVRTKQRGIAACDTFLKRKLKKRDTICRKRETITKTESIAKGESISKGQGITYKFREVCASEHRSEKSIKEEMGYLALLKYKDGSFLRLRQNDLRSIFTNPLYANEKFRHNNFTQYIQCLPQEGTEELRIHYSSKFREHALFEAATGYQLAKREFGERAVLRRHLLQHDPILFLYFTVFEICAYISIHHHRRIQAGTFHFVKEADGWALADIEGARLLLQEKDFMRANMWTEQRKVTFDEKENEKEMFRLKEQAKTPFYRKVEAHFEQTNAAIRTNMLTFLHQKVSNIKRTSDKLLSRSIFHILHPERKANNLYDLLDSPTHLAALVSPANQRKTGSQKGKEAEKEEKSKVVVGKRRAVKECFVYRGIESVRCQFQDFQEK